MKAHIANTMKIKYLLPVGTSMTTSGPVVEGVNHPTRTPSADLDEATTDWKSFVISDGSVVEGANHILVTGEPLTEAIALIDRIIGKSGASAAGSINALSSTTAAAGSGSVNGGESADEVAVLFFPDDLFDKLEFIVFCSLRTAHQDSFRASNYYTEYINFIMLSTKPLTIDDFTLFRVLGRGGFGVVNGCKHSHTGKLYAMKVMERKRIKAMRAEMLVLTERNTMLMLDSPFIVGLKYAFTTPTELYLILDLMLGGDLGYLLYRRGPFNSLEVKYYAARTVLGLKALHDLGIVFRGKMRAQLKSLTDCWLNVYACCLFADLKPENILMDQAGRTRLSDLGLAVPVYKKGITGTCGSRGYW
jgi:hypothetical protein